jgi:hypothetical protein
LWVNGWVVGGSRRRHTYIHTHIHPHPHTPTPTHLVHHHRGQQVEEPVEEPALRGGVEGEGGVVGPHGGSHLVFGWVVGVVGWFGGSRERQRE